MDRAPAGPGPVARARLKKGPSSLVAHTHSRNLAQLRAAYPRLTPDELAQRLVADAARKSAVVGVAAACCAFAPIPASAPLATAGDSAATSALRARLTSELRTVYGLRDPRPMNESGAGYLARLASREAGGVVTLLAALPTLALAATRALPKQLRLRVRLSTLFTASAVSAGLRRGRATRRFGEALRRDLRAEPTAWSRWPEEPTAPPP